MIEAFDAFVTHHPDFTGGVVVAVVVIVAIIAALLNSIFGKRSL